MPNDLENKLNMLQERIREIERAKQEAKRQAEAHQVLRSQSTTEEKHDSVQSTFSNAVQRDDKVTQALTEQLEASRKLRAQLEKDEQVNIQDSGIRKTLRLAAYTVAMEMQGLTQKEIENKLLNELSEKADFQKEALEQDFKEEMQLQPERKIIDELTVNPDNPNNKPDLDATLLLERGPENLPNVPGGIQAVRFYEEGNRVGVVLYTDKPNPSGAKNLLEHFEEIADRKLAAAKKNVAAMDDEKPQARQAKEAELPKPTPQAKKQDEDEEKQKIKNEVKKDNKDKTEDLAQAEDKPRSTIPNPFKTRPTPTSE